MRLIALVGTGLRIECQNYAVRIAFRVRLIQRHDLQARPVFRAADKLTRRGAAQDRQRQPEARQQLERLRQRGGALRLHHFGRRAVLLRQQKAAAGGVRHHAQQRAVGRLAHEVARLAVVQADSEIKKLDAAFGNQGNFLFKISDGRQHSYLLSRLIDIG